MPDINGPHLSDTTTNEGLFTNKNTAKIIHWIVCHWYKPKHQIRLFPLKMYTSFSTVATTVMMTLRWCMWPYTQKYTEILLHLDTYSRWDTIAWCDMTCSIMDDSYKVDYCTTTYCVQWKLKWSACYQQHTLHANFAPKVYCTQTQLRNERRSETIKHSLKLNTELNVCLKMFISLVAAAACFICRFCCPIVWHPLLVTCWSHLQLVDHITCLAKCFLTHSRLQSQPT